MQMCSLRLQFHDLLKGHKITVNQTGAFYFSQACSEDVFDFRNKLMIPISFYFRAYGCFFMAGVHQQPEQSNYLAEGQT